MARSCATWRRWRDRDRIAYVDPGRIGPSHDTGLSDSRRRWLRRRPYRASRRLHDRERFTDRKRFDRHAQSCRSKRGSCGRQLGAPQRNGGSFGSFGGRGSCRHQGRASPVGRYRPCRRIVRPAGSALSIGSEKNRLTDHGGSHIREGLGDRRIRADGSRGRR